MMPKNVLGMVYSNDECLFFVTDKRKNVHSDLQNNPEVELASYSIYTHKWIRIHGRAKTDNSTETKEEVMTKYPDLRYKYHNDDEINLAIYKLFIEKVSFI